MLLSFLHKHLICLLTFYEGYQYSQITHVMLLQNLAALHVLCRGTAMYAKLLKQWVPASNISHAVEPPPNPS